MDIIIDIQFLKNEQNVCIPKEMAVIAVNEDFASHWVVSSSSISIKKLNKSIKRQNEWLTQNHHGLDYTEGEVSLNTLIRSLREITRKIRRIYVRGQEKLNYMQKITSREVINLECINECPPFHDLPWCSKYCFHHGIKPMHLKFSCALNNVCRLKLWLTTDRHIDLIDNSYFELPTEACDEQPRDFKSSLEYTHTYGGCIRSRSDSLGVDETDSVCV